MKTQVTLILAICAVGCSELSDQHQSVDQSRLLNSDQTPEEWLSYGLNYAETRHSPLNQINRSTVESLGLAWSINLGTRRGLEATPLVVNGVMYFTGTWSQVYAVDVRKGEILWTYDPEVPREWGEKVCCDVVNRGVAVYEDKVYVGSLDGRLIALNAENGQKAWEVLTVDQSKPYSITGAPRVVKGNVIIGNGGADLGVRGYLTAYDASTGELDWRFYSVPGNPNEPFESEAMKIAADTWTGEWWKYGGGGTPWDAMAYDPELDLLYVGIGNGAPWNRDLRSPDGGDNLYLSSIVALNPDDGTLQWHYQTTPGDTWDYTATQHIILADLSIDGSDRKVLMQAPKNGFFYVLDRTDGDLISAQPYVYTNWAKQIDLETGRPIETEFARYPEANVQIAPSPVGGHNWHPMAFNSKTGLVYIPVRESNMFYGQPADWRFADDSRSWNTGTDVDPEKETIDDPLAGETSGKLIAWNPVTQKEEWSVWQESPWNAGVLTTDDLVFQGNAEGEFSAYDAVTGERVWSFPLETGIVASPITYELDGIQYVSVLVGWGGVMGLYSKYTDQINPGALYTFALGAKGDKPEFPSLEVSSLVDLDYDADPERIANGGKLFQRYCDQCHGGGVIPDLLYSSAEMFAAFEDIVGKGTLLGLGMPNFEGRLDEGEIRDIRHYVLHTARMKKQEQQSL